MHHQRALLENDQLDNERNNRNIPVLPLITLVVFIATFTYWFHQEDFFTGILAAIMITTVAYFAFKFAIEYAMETTKDVENPTVRALLFFFWIIVSLGAVDLIFLGRFFIEPVFTFLNTGSLECTIYNYPEHCD